MYVYTLFNVFSKYILSNIFLNLKYCSLYNWIGSLRSELMPVLNSYLARQKNETELDTRQGQYANGFGVQVSFIWVVQHIILDITEWLDRPGGCATMWENFCGD